jgi:hypothetical protein
MALASQAVLAFTDNVPTRRLGMNGLAEVQAHEFFAAEDFERLNTSLATVPYWKLLKLLVCCG